jgi:N-acetylmuramoyl-L-alanine amidase
MVLIGAQMPAALAEITFLTNKQEQTWLKTELYKRQLAEALFNGIMAYQRALKGAQVASAR